MRGQNLRSADVAFDEIRVLQAREFDGEAIFDVAHNAAPGHSNRDNDAYRGRRSVEIPIAATRLRSRGSPHWCHLAIANPFSRTRATFPSSGIVNDGLAAVPAGGRCEATAVDAIAVPQARLCAGRPETPEMPEGTPDRAPSPA